MALSRPVVLAALGVLLAVATFASMRSAADRAQADDTAAAPTVQPAAGGSSTGAEPSTSAPAAPAKPAPAAPAKPAPAPKPASKPKKKKPPAVTGVPPKVGKALSARRTVVLFFRQPAADDAATAAAVRSLRGIKRVSVFTAPITKLARYRRVVATLGVTQAPAVVIVGKDRKARLIEGFVDAGTLRQIVRDSR